MYNNISLLSGLGKREKISPLVAYLWLLMVWIWPLYSLSQDTLQIQDTSESVMLQDSVTVPYIAETAQPELQWLPQIRRTRTELDSLNIRYHLLDDLQIDTVGIESMLDHLSVMNQDVSRWRIESTQSRKETQNINLDSTAEDGSHQKLRTRMQADSLAVVDSLLTQLSLDIGLLSSNLLQFRDHEGIVKTDTILSSTDSIPQRSIVKRMRQNMELDQSLHAYFNLDAWGGRILLILISLGYFYFLYIQGKKVNTTEGNVPLYQNEPIWIPVLKTLVFFGMLLPLFSFQIPVFVIQVVYFCLFMVLYILLYQRYSEERKWIIFLWAFVYAFLIASNLILSEEIWSRVLAAIGNLTAFLLTWRLFARTKLKTTFHYIPRYALRFLLGGFAIALITNLIGYITLSRMFSVASAVGFIQGLVLSASTKMIMHDVKRYYEEAGEEKVIRRFDVTQLNRSLTRVLAIVNIMIVLSVLINTLGIADTVQDGMERIFLKQRAIGGITYSYANLVFAILALLAANWLQKTLNQILNPPTGEDSEVKKYALFPLFRLLIVVLGFLIAIAILGVGVTQLTVVVGALSVGIGLGLQNIINNFVSGIILIFEKPFKIGDYIELADKRGRVHQIGIRSSVLISDQGGKVIIPNGDLLSGRIVNWTLYGAQIHFGLELVIGNTIPIKQLKNNLREMLENNRYVEKAAPIHVYTKSIQADTHTVSLQVVLKHVRYMEQFRGTFLEKVKNEMDTKEVKITSS